MSQITEIRAKPPKQAN